VTRPPPELVAEWNRRLAASGFKDIEKFGTTFLDQHIGEVGRRSRRALETAAGGYWDQFGKWMVRVAWPTRAARLTAALLASGVSLSEVPGLQPRLPKGFPTVTQAWKTEVLAWKDPEDE